MKKGQSIKFRRFNGVAAVGQYLRKKDHVNGAYHEVRVDGRDKPLKIRAGQITHIDGAAEPDDASQHHPGGEPDSLDPLQLAIKNRIEEKVRHLAEYARIMGFVLTVEQVSLWPPASGHHRDVVTVRKARKPGGVY